MSELDSAESLHVAIARLEGKIDSWAMQQSRHEERLDAHSAKLDSQQEQLTSLTASVATRAEEQAEKRRNTPGWPTVVSAVIAAVMAVLFIAQQMFGAG